MIDFYLLILGESNFFTFPHSMWGIVESYSNLTPRGLVSPVTSSENIKELNK